MSVGVKERWTWRWRRRLRWHQWRWQQPWRHNDNENNRVDNNDDDNNDDGDGNMRLSVGTWRWRRRWWQQRWRWRWEFPTLKLRHVDSFESKTGEMNVSVGDKKVRLKVTMTVTNSGNFRRFRCDVSTVLSIDFERLKNSVLLLWGCCGRLPEGKKRRECCCSETDSWVGRRVEKWPEKWRCDARKEKWLENVVYKKKRELRAKI